jgi:hypothetical protein
MARRKDLGGLAALAGLAYMASRDKAAKCESAPTGDDQYNPDVKQRSPDMGAIFAEDGTLSKLRRNTETGDLYSPDEPITRPAATASTSSSRPAASSRATPSTQASSSSKGVDLGTSNAGYDSRTPAKKEYYRDLSGKMREKAPDTSAEDAAARRAKVGAALSDAASSVGDYLGDLGKREQKHGTYRTFDGKVVRYAKGGTTKAKSPAASVKGWGAARGARKAKIY